MKGTGMFEKFSSGCLCKSKLTVRDVTSGNVLPGFTGINRILKFQKPRSSN